MELNAVVSNQYSYARQYQMLLILIKVLIDMPMSIQLLGHDIREYELLLGIGKDKLQLLQTLIASPTI